MQCLPKHIVEKLIKKLDTIEVETLMNMSTEARRAFLSDVVGQENVGWVNTQIEGKMILKHQQQGIQNWIKKQAKGETKVQRDMLSRVEKMTDILTPKTEDAFLEDLVAHKLGVAVTLEEAANIMALSKEAITKRQIMESSPRRGEDDPATQTELDYGIASTAFTNYIGVLKLAAREKTLTQTLKNYLDHPIEFVNDLTGAMKSAVGSMDDSFVGRQGIVEFYRGLTGNKDAAKNWWKTFKQSIDAIVKTFQGVSAIDALNAEIISDPEVELMRRAKVDLFTTEEAYPSALPEKIPFGVGKVFKAGEEAFVVSAHAMRYRAFKNYLKVWRKSGIELTDFELKSIGKLVNSLTARGDIGGSGKPGLINNLLWSPRNIKGALDVLTAHVFSGASISRKAKKEAAINLIRLIAGTAFLLAIADFIDDDSVTFDPRSSDFGKIKVGNTRYSIAGSFPGYITLASRLVTKARVSASGQQIQYNKGKFGELTMKDSVFDFFANKASPPTRFVLDWLEGKDFQGRPFNVWKETFQTMTPMQISNFIETASAEDSANLIIVMLAETFGINANTYIPNEKGGTKKTKAVSRQFSK